MSPSSTDDEPTLLASLRKRLSSDATINRKELSSLGELHGSLDLCLTSYLREGFNRRDPAIAHARINDTLLHRREYGLDAASNAALSRQMDESPVHAAWPARLCATAPDGSPVVYCKLSALDLPALSRFPEPQFRGYVALWFECCSRLIGDSSREHGALCKGTYEIYDGTGARWHKLIIGLQSCKAAVRTVIALSQHCPDGLHKSFVINAPPLASTLYMLLQPFLSERARTKISIHRGVPVELEQALGGKAALRSAMESVPDPGAAAK